MCWFCVEVGAGFFLVYADCRVTDACVYFVLLRGLLCGSSCALPLVPGRHVVWDSGGLCVLRGSEDRWANPVGARVKGFYVYVCDCKARFFCWYGRSCEGGCCPRLAVDGEEPVVFCADDFRFFRVVSEGIEASSCGFSRVVVCVALFQFDGVCDGSFHSPWIGVECGLGGVRVV